MNIEKFSKDELKIIRTEIDNALLGVGEKYGIKFRLGNISFSESEFNGKLNATLLNKVEENKEEKFKRECKYIGLNESDFGKEFEMVGKSYVVCDIDLSKRKYPLIALCKQDGRKYKVAVSMFRMVS